MVESGPVFFAVRFSPGLKPEISGAATLMNWRDFAKNELSFIRNKMDLYAFSIVLKCPFEADESVEGVTTYPLSKSKLRNGPIAQSLTPAAWA